MEDKTFKDFVLLLLANTSHLVPGFDAKSCRSTSWLQCIPHSSENRVVQSVDQHFSENLKPNKELGELMDAKISQRHRSVHPVNTGAKLTPVHSTQNETLSPKYSLDKSEEKQNSEQNIFRLPLMCSTHPSPRHQILYSHPVLTCVSVPLYSQSSQSISSDLRVLRIAMSYAFLCTASVFKKPVKSQTHIRSFRQSASFPLLLLFFPLCTGPGTHCHP